MEVVELLKELIKRQSITPNECGIYEIIKAELADFEAIEVEKNGVKNLFLYKDFSVDCHDSAFAESRNDENIKNQNTNSSIFDEKSGLRSHERGNRTNGSLTKRTTSLPDLSQKDAEFATKPHLCFAGHIDVVPAGFGWSVPPFDAVIQNGVLYGRGAQDMKGGVAAFVSALQKVKHFNGTLSVLLTSDEEGDGVFGTKIMLEALKERGLLPHFAIVAEPTCEKKLGDSIKIGRRGSVNGVLKIYGTQGHAAYPHKCVNPLDLIAPILAQISSKDLDNGSEYFAPSKIVITDIRGGIEATNVTPAELKLMFNVRNNPLTDKNAIQSYIESLLKSAGIVRYELTLSQTSFPFITNSSVLLDSLSRVVKARTNITPRPNTEGGTSDARYFSAFGVEVVEFGLVNDRIHAVDECVNLCDLEALRDIFVDFIADFDSATKSQNTQNNQSVDCHDSANPESRNDESNQNDSISNANSSIVSEFLGLCEVSNDDKTNSLSRKRTEALPKKSPQD